MGFETPAPQQDEAGHAEKHPPPDGERRVAELADVAHVLYDLRGCGPSQRTPPLGDLPHSALQPELLADDVAGLIRKLRADRADVLEASVDCQERGKLCAEIGFDDPLMADADAPDGALSRAMVFGGAPRDIWRPDRLHEWHRLLDQVRFSSEKNKPFAAGMLRPGAPHHPVQVLRKWRGRVLILHGEREMGFRSRWRAASTGNCRQAAWSRCLAPLIWRT